MLHRAAPSPERVMAGKWNRNIRRISVQQGDEALKKMCTLTQLIIQLRKVV